MGLDIVSLGMQLLDKVIPDPTAKAQAQLALQTLAQQGQLAQLQADTSIVNSQISVDKTEAANESFFVAGGRPAIIWVGAISLACYYIPYALASTSIWALECLQQHHMIARPDMGLTDLLGLVAPLLGVSGLRSYEKVVGKS